MLVSYKWLDEYFDKKLPAVEKIVDVLTMHSQEVEGVEKIDDDGKSESTDDESGSEELDITDLVTSQEEIKTKQEEFMNTMFQKIDDLESKLNQMDQIMTKIDSIETKVEKYRNKSPEEKLMLRSLDSYPYTYEISNDGDYNSLLNKVREILVKAKIIS